MYITINNLVGEKKVDLSYSILGFEREIAVISIFTKKLPNEIKEDLREELQLGKSKQKEKLLEMNFILNELDNTKTLQDGKLSNILFRHYVPSSEDAIHYDTSRKYGSIHRCSWRRRRRYSRISQRMDP